MNGGVFSVMKEPIERLAASLETTSVMIMQFLGRHDGITLRYDPPAGWICDSAAPVVWFSAPLLSTGNLGPWKISDGLVKLQSANGAWVWRLTDEWRTGDNIIDGPQSQRRGVWPD